jgi:hypothetical protein
MTRISGNILQERRRMSGADADYLISFWSFVVKMRHDIREHLSLEEAECLETAAKSVARYLNLTDSRRFQEHLQHLPEDFPLAM